jgi:hypothetical protein
MLYVIRKEFEVAGVLTDVTTAKLSDPTGTYGIKRNDTNAVIVVDGTAMTKDSTGIYSYSFTPVVSISYTAYVEFVYLGSTYHIEVDIPAYTSAGTMVASYSSLLERVGHFLFGIRSSFSADQTSDIEECIRDGLHDVYSAHSWSFFRPTKLITTTAPYSTGTVTIASGVVTLAGTGAVFPSWAAYGVLEVDDEYYEVSTRDSNAQITLDDTSVTAAAGSTYELTQQEYDLPTGFEAIEGSLTYERGMADGYPPVEFRHDEEIRKRQQDDPWTDHPRYFSVRTVEFDATVGSRRRLVFYPTPDVAYVLKARMKLRATMIDATNQYPVGGEAITQLIVEACLAAAERNYDEEAKQHTRRFMEMLPLAIQADMEMTSPTTLGSDAPRERNGYLMSRSALVGAITLNGVEM